MPGPITNDYDVCRALQKGKRNLAAAKAAKLTGLTPFQITARLKGMEGRNLVKRSEGLWQLTEDGAALARGPRPAPPPRVRAVPPAPGGPPAAGLPDDTGVLVLDSCRGWKLRYLWGHSRRIELYATPEGEEFVEASAFENADAILKASKSGVKVRLRRKESSGAARRIEKAIQKDRERELAKQRA